MATAEPLGAGAARVMATAAPLGAAVAMATATAPLAVVATPAGTVAAAALPGAGAPQPTVNGVNAEVNARAPPPPIAVVAVEM